MIRVNDDYVILVDEMNYAPARDRHRTVMSKGKERAVYDIIGYASTLERAVKMILDRTTTEILTNGEISLADAVKEIREINSQFEEMLGVAVRGDTR